MKEFILKDDFNLSKANIDYEAQLNSEQLQVVLNADGPSLVLAGAGSGKTRTITYRVAYLLERGISADNILLVTFTNKASREMIERVEQLLGAYPKGLWAGTFHSIANRLLRIYADAIGFSRKFTIIDQEDGRSIIRVCVKELKIDTTARRFPSPSKLLGMISYSRNSAQSIRQVIESRYSNFIELAPLIERIAEMYETRKREADSMDFDDLLLKLRELLFTNETIRRRLAAQFQYVLVDEYQDTNVIQAQIINQLSKEHCNLLVVGDDAQSIYSFRAAEIRNILGFPQTYSGAKTFRLTTNYRSSPEILAIANASITQNKDQFKKELSAVRGSLERPNLVPANNSAQEATYIAQQILVLRDDGVPLSEVAVLFRAAFHSQSLEFELMKRDIPYEYRGGLKFFERAHVKDVIAHMRVKMNPKDEVAWMRILGHQNGIGLVTAQKIARQVRDVESIGDILKLEIKVPKRAQIGWETLLRTIKKIAHEELPSDLIRTVIAGDYRDYLEAEYPDFMDRLEDLEQFSLFSEGYTSLQPLLDEVTLAADYGAVRDDNYLDDEEKMVLSTIHQSKGLEWDAVFIMHLIDGKFPNGKALEEDGGLEEERRLFYVATTRARKRLYYTYPITAGYDTFMISQPSMFLQELPDELFEQVRLRVPISSSSYSSRNNGGFRDDAPTIVFNDFGEEKKDIPEGLSFLRDLDEL